MFNDRGSEIEHDAFRALWLGVRLAIALAVLASVHKDSRFLKDKIVLSDAMSVIVRALMQLVQIWTWERFLKISPKCEIVFNPKFATWEKTNVCVDNVGSFVDHLMNLFCFKKQFEKPKQEDNILEKRTHAKTTKGMSLITIIIR
ncbi:aminotransferase-like mobile domain-containing protein [Tanacetum coccineum]